MIPADELRAPTGLTCPICANTPLAKTERDGYACHACARCGGIYMEWKVIRDLELSFESARPRRDSATKTLPPPRDPGQDRPLYRLCPRCGKQMSRQCYQRVSRVVADTCFGHGIWLDRNELEHVVAFLESGGLEKSREHESARERYHKTQKKVIPKLLHDMRWRTLGR